MSHERRRARLVEVKICGVTNLSDALDAVDCGADALGFNLFSGSKRFIQINTAGEWMAKVPAGIRKVAVMVDPTLAEAMRTAQLPFIDSLQLHGNESAEFCSELAKHGVRFTKALPMRDETSVQQPAHFSTVSVLLDSGRAGTFGGSGETFPWSLAYRFIEAHPELRVILAGGLTPENVAEAIDRVRPAGVDVTSGVESSVGRKDRRLLQAFVGAVTAA
jgi:phosphoribosylanthranilate isomerase